MVAMPASELPAIGFFPALPLDREIALGEWVVGPAPTGASWLSGDFRTTAEKVIGSCVRDGFENSARLWHRDRGFDGSYPGESVLAAITAAIRFALLDANDHVPDWRKGQAFATSENAALYLQYVDVETGFITHVRGGALRSATIGGHRIGGRPIPLPDAVMPIDGAAKVSARLAAGVFDALVRDETSAVRRLGTAIEWHGVIMANPSAVTLSQRLIGLKTAFEALLGCSKSREGARLLRKLFEQATANDRERLPWVGLLWSPRDRVDLERRFKQKPDIRSEIEDWFMMMSKVRNDIIHEGRLTATEYPKPRERPLSRYVGPIFWTGERLLREAVKATLGSEILLCGRHDWRDIWRSIQREQQNTDGGNPSTEEDAIADDRPADFHRIDPGAPPPEVAPPSGDLVGLLRQLSCNSANEVRLARDGRGAKSSDGSVEMEVTSPQWLLLKSAGAEEEISGIWMMCD